MWALTNVKSEKSVKTEKYQFAPKSRHEGLVANRRLDFQEEGEINEKSVDYPICNKIVNISPRTDFGKKRE